jgi:hypothetical protein
MRLRLSLKISSTQLKKIQRPKKLLMKKMERATVMRKKMSLMREKTTAMKK